MGLLYPLLVWEPNTGTSGAHAVDLRIDDVGARGAEPATGLSLPEAKAKGFTFPTAAAAYWWWILILYMFYCMAAICDEYLVPAVDKICERFHIPEDVAGATLVAFACNGPELLTNVCGIFVTKSSVGMGTIVGSAIFNVLIICASCPLCSP